MISNDSSSPIAWAWRQQVQGPKPKLILVAMSSLMPNFNVGFSFTNENRKRLEWMTGVETGKVFPIVNGLVKSGILLHEGYEGEAITVKPNLASIPYPEFALLRRDRPGYVYLLQHEGRYKVGKTQDIQARVRSLQTGASHSLEIIACKEVSDAPGYESFLHRMYERRRTKGEWFQLIPTEVAAVTEALGGRYQ